MTSLLETFLDKEAITTEGLTSSLEGIPEVKHSVVEEFFQNFEDKETPYRWVYLFKPQENLSKSTCALDVIIQ